MSVVINQPVNALPVKTYRWLKLNEYNIEPLTIALKPYGKEFITNFDKFASRVTLTKTDATNQQVSLSSAGLSPQLSELCSKESNAGITVHVPVGISINEPLKIEYQLDQTDDVLIDHNIIVAEANSQITILFDYNSSPDLHGFHTGLTQIHAKAGSVVNLIKIQRMADQSYHFDANIAEIEPNAQVNFIQVELGAKLSATSYTNNLNDASGATINSIYLGDGERVIDLSYLMNHLGRHSISNINTQGVMKDHSQKAFKGTIDFKKGAVRSEGREHEYVLLLDPTVKADSVPLLLCHEDDVQGEHAASFGKIDQDRLFYLMSRGFNREDAIKLLVEAIFNPIIDQIPLPDMQEEVKEFVQRRLASE